MIGLAIALGLIILTAVYVGEWLKDPAQRKRGTR